ncbi:MAG: efflux transporter outer membrane subunit, partial [Pseudomonadota bacterium]
MKTKLIAGACCALLAGCVVGPDYEAPVMETGADWVQGTEPGEPVVDNWWEQFGDEQLTALVLQAHATNISVRASYANIARARALRSLSGSRNGPVLDVGGSVTRRKQSANGPLPVDEIPAIDAYQTIYDTGFDAAWELDLFGGNRRRNEAADARIDQAVAQAADFRLAVGAEVARAYLELRGAQREFDAVEESVAVLDERARLLATGAAAGEYTTGDVSRAQSELAANRARLPALEAQVRDLAMVIAVLLGKLPESVLPLASSPPPSAPALSPLPVGQRADVLLRRADVRAAERALAAATADSGVAHAERFPKLGLSGNAGFQALDAGDLTDSDSVFWGIAPVISWRVLDGGRVQAEIAASEAEVVLAALEYERTVLQALADAEQALSRYQFSLGITR